ncbi:hypothetical protein, partial [Variovorax sp. CCNWLW235]|uniref:hypothetical protein n=1 Tax=Variovorax sp. CCNWLW235 TaxID=3127463 RepID=UPI0030778F3B
MTEFCRSREGLVLADCVEKLALNLACAGDHTEILIVLTMREHVASLQAHLTQSSLPQLLQM